MSSAEVIQLAEGKEGSGRPDIIVWAVAAAEVI